MAMRLAWFTPWPPDRSGVAGRSAEVVPRLAARGCAIDVFVDERRIDVRRDVAAEPPPDGEVRVLGAHEFVWRASRHPYDLPVYQIGNSRLHEYIWPYLLRWPGLTVLHDARVHHARARALLRRGDVDAYRAEFAWSHPYVSPDAAELAVAGLHGVYYYQWPMLRGVLAASRLVATHAPEAIGAIDVPEPSAPIDHITLGEGETTRDAASPERRQRRRTSAGMSPDDVVFGAFGALSEYRRIEPILRAFAVVHASHPAMKLVLAGTIDPALRLTETLDALGISAVTHVHPSPDDGTFDEWIGAVDVSLNLRWPTSREVSGPWLRALAAGRASIIIDLEQSARLPTLDPRTWARHTPAAPGPARHAPIAVAVDILDEDHSLRRALLRLAHDASLRESLGRAAREYWEAHHTTSRMVADYERVIARAAALPPPQSSLPRWLRPDPLSHVLTALDQFGPAAGRRLEPLRASWPAR
jgi:glycosyltransferase involved in cell wall biosynthesis